MTLGNNDPPFHYQTPTGDIGKDYYEFMFEAFFKNHTGNRDFAGA